METKEEAMREKSIPVKYVCASCRNEEIVLFSPGEKTPDIKRCVGRCTGTMERKTSDSAIVRMERVERCAEANTDEAVRMRHCEHCEVPVGTMSLAAFNLLYKCGVCGQLVHAGGES